LKRFCINCGIEESETTPIIKGLCPKCYAMLRGLASAPQSMDIEFCRACGAIKVHGKWVYVHNLDEAREVVEDLVIDLLKPSEDVVLEDVKAFFKLYESSTATVDVIGKLGGVRVSQTITMQLNWRPTLCPLCRKIAGGSYSAVVQVRYVNKDRDIDEFINELRSLYGKWIKEVKPVKNGYDIMLLGSEVAKRIVEDFKRRWHAVKIVESYGDTRRLSTGETVSRLYISVRILNFKPGDYVIIDGKPYTVDAIEGSWLTIRDSDNNIKKIHINEVVEGIDKYRAKKSR
jgi:nonsense-mediated mRNA decay protein 3